MQIQLLAVTVALAFGGLALEGADPQNTAISNEALFEALAIGEGSTVCEIGAGNGAATIAAARAVGPAGRVYSSELGDVRVKALRDAVERSGLSQITVIAGAVTTTNFPDEACDAVFMRDVYHHLSDPAAMNRAMTGALKPGGRAAIVDFTPPPGSEAPTPADRAKDGMHGISPEAMLRELDAAGFERVRSELSAQRWFMVIVAKPKHWPSFAMNTDAR